MAVVPFKGGSAGKTRLRSALSVEQRGTLSREMLTHVLGVLDKVPAISDVVVVSSDAMDHTNRLPDPGAGLNSAIEAGINWAVDRGALKALVLPADLPFLSPLDVIALLDASPKGPGVVVAPSKDGGTGALLLNPPDMIQPAFGPGSGSGHRQSLPASRGQTIVVRRSGLAIDIDTPDDLDLLGDDLLDVVWGSDNPRGRGTVYSPYEPSEDACGAYLDE